MNCTGYPDWYDDELPSLKEVCPFNFECESCGYDCEVDVDVEQNLLATQ